MRVVAPLDTERARAVMHGSPASRLIDHALEPRHPRSRGVTARFATSAAPLHHLEPGVHAATHAIDGPAAVVVCHHRLVAPVWQAPPVAAGDAVPASEPIRVELVQRGAELLVRCLALSEVRHWLDRVRCLGPARACEVGPEQRGVEPIDDAVTADGRPVGRTRHWPPARRRRRHHARAAQRSRRRWCCEAAARMLRRALGWCVRRCMCRDQRERARQRRWRR